MFGGFIRSVGSRIDNFFRIIDYIWVHGFASWDPRVSLGFWWQESHEDVSTIDLSTLQRF